MGRASSSKRKRERPADGAEATLEVDPADAGALPERVESGPRSGGRGSMALLALAVVLVAAWVNLNTLGLSWTWDDDWLILENPRIQDPTYVRYMLFEKERVWRPLKRMSFMLDAYLWGFDSVEEPSGLGDRLKGSTGFHLSNLIFQTGACLALFFFLCRLRLEPYVAAAIAILFAVHPIHVESVANISHRKEPMALLFYLLAFIVYLRGREKSAIPARVVHTIGFFFLFLCGYLSKEVGVIMLPFMVLAYELMLARESWRERGRNLAWVAVPPTLAAFALFSGRGYLSPSKLLGYFGTEQYEWITEDQASTYGPVFLTAFKSFGAAVRDLIWPSPLYLDRDFPLARSIADPGFLFGALAVGVIVFIVATRFRRNPYLCFGLLWLLLNYLPVANFIPLTHWLYAERMVYVPSVGWAIVVGLGLDRLRRGNIPGLEPRLGYRVAAGLFAALVVILGVATVRQNRVWNNSSTLWAHTLKYNDRSYRALHGYGLELYNADDYDGARDHYERAIAVNPSYPEPRYALALLLLNEKKYDDAIRHAEVHASLDEDDPEPFMVIGNAEFALAAQSDETDPARRYAPASRAYAKAIDRDDEHADAMYNLANVTNAMRRHEEAAKLLQTVVQVDPSTDAYILLGNALEFLKRADEATEAYFRAHESSPEELSAINALGRLYARAGRYEEALQMLDQSIMIDPDQTSVPRLRDWILSKME